MNSDKSSSDMNSDKQKSYVSDDPFINIAMIFRDSLEGKKRINHGWNKLMGSGSRRPQERASEPFPKEKNRSHIISDESPNDKKNAGLSSKRDVRERINHSRNRTFSDSSRNKVPGISDPLPCIEDPRPQGGDGKTDQKRNNINKDL